jgi:hypothetical protein
MTPKMSSAIESYVIPRMATAFPSVPVIVSNQAIPAGATTYVKLYILASDDPLPVGLGRTAKSRHVGVLQATVIGQKDIGAGYTGDIAEFLRVDWTRLVITVPGEGSVIFKDGSIRDMGSKGEEFTQIVRCGYRFDLAVN